jgi:hypothetical protein
MVMVPQATFRLGTMKTRSSAEGGEKIRRKRQPVLDVQVIPAPTIFWHLSVPWKS